MENKAGNNDFAKPIQWGLFFVAAICVTCAFLRMAFPNKVDEKTAMFLGLAIVALVIHQLTKFKGFGIEFEKEVGRLKEDVQTVKKDVKTVEVAVDGLEKEVGPGSKTALTMPLSTVLAAENVTLTNQTLIDPNDPNKGQFGGKPEANGRKLSATIKPEAGPKSSRCLVTLQIESTTPTKPLRGKARILLHPTFGQRASYEVESKGGIVKESIVSYGAFTVGVEADDGKTRLELDLADVPGGTDRFYEL